MIHVTIYTASRSYDLSMNKHDYTDFILGSLTGVIETKWYYYGRLETIYIKASKIEAITTEEKDDD